MKTLIVVKIDSVLGEEIIRKKRYIYIYSLLINIGSCIKEEEKKDFYIRIRGDRLMIITWKFDSTLEDIISINKR